MKVGLGMLVLGVAVSLLSAGADGNPGLNGFSAFVAFAGLIILIIGAGKWRERPAGD
jgi:hypothetical protein